MQANRGARCFKRYHHRCEEKGSLDNYANKRILPHISEEYEFRITNRLLVGKILNPRRDKTIMDSLVKASNKFKVKNEHPPPSTPATIHRRKIVAGNKHDTSSQAKTRNETRLNTETSPTRHHTQNMERLMCSLQEPDSTLNSIHDKENRPMRPQSRLRNNFVGRIIRNQWREESVVAETAVSTELPDFPRSKNTPRPVKIPFEGETLRVRECWDDEEEAYEMEEELEGGEAEF